MTANPEPLWWPEELQALQLPEKLTVADWCDKYRTLSPRTTASPGAWRTDRVPFSREILNAFGDPWVSELTFVASTQVSKTECALNMLAYAMRNDPKTALMVLPTDTDCRKMSSERLRPLFEDNPDLVGLTTGNPDDLKLTALHLVLCSVYLSSANSPSQLASMPIRYLFLDETDKYKAFSGGEASPIKLARERTRTFWNRKIVKTCTPTTEEGYILQEYKKSDRGKYVVPCFHCSWWHVLSFKSIQWPDDCRDSEKVLNEDLAEYFCPQCGEAIADKHKLAMLQAGKWYSERYQTVDNATGRLLGTLPERRAHRGFWLNALYSPWLTWSEIAAEWLDSYENPQDHMNFVNSWLAEPWKDRTSMPELDALLALRRPLQPGTCPRDAVGVTIGIDMQQRGFYWCAWAFTAEMQSHLLLYGYADTWEELEGVVFDSTFPVQGEPEQSLVIARGLLDTGGGATEEGFSRTEEAYQWLRIHGQGVVYGCKGLSSPGATTARNRASQVDQLPGKKRGSSKGLLTLRLLDTGAYKDLLFRRMTEGSTEPATFHADTGADYARQLLAEQRRRNPRTGKYQWVEIRRDNHYLDATVYAHAAADPQWDGGFLVRPRSRKKPKRVVKRQEQKHLW